MDLKEKMTVRLPDTKFEIHVCETGIAFYHDNFLVLDASLMVEDKEIVIWGDQLDKQKLRVVVK